MAVVLSSFYISTLYHKRVPRSMSASAVSRYAKVRLPLWQRRVPRYPFFVEGRPQYRVLLCQFWMKLVKPNTAVRKDHVHFEIHPQMSKLDVKQYLEKIYDVDVVDARTYRTRSRPVVKKQYHIQRIAKFPRVKRAYVQLGGNHEFTFPNLFADVQIETIRKKTEKMIEKSEHERMQEQWDMPGIPVWLR